MKLIIGKYKRLQTEDGTNLSFKDLYKLYQSEVPFYIYNPYTKRDVTDKVIKRLMEGAELREFNEYK